MRGKHIKPLSPGPFHITTHNLTFVNVSLLLTDLILPRLRANGIMSVENPVRTAVQEGRFEELPDDYKEDSD